MKSGLDYFPLDVCLDDNFRLIEAEFGLTGFAVVVKLLQKIYGQCGYYCEWKNEVALLFARENGLGGNAVSEIVEASIRRGIFDKTLYEKYGILTSHGIQKRYFEAVSRRKNVEVKKQYLLVEVAKKKENVSVFEKNVNIFEKNVDISKQSKVEESKVITNTNTVTITAATPQNQPTFEEVKEYCKRKGLKVNPKRFYKTYSKNNWKTKDGTPIDDWYSLLEHWDKTQKDEKAITENSSFSTDDFFNAALTKSYQQN